MGGYCYLSGWLPVAAVPWWPWRYGAARFLSSSAIKPRREGRDVQARNIMGIHTGGVHCLIAEGKLRGGRFLCRRTYRGACRHPLREVAHVLWRLIRSLGAADSAAHLACALVFSQCLRKRSCVHWFGRAVILVCSITERDYVNAELGAFKFV